MAAGIRARLLVAQLHFVQALLLAQCHHPLSRNYGDWINDDLMLTDITCSVT
jgi:hypothetical protein